MAKADPCERDVTAEPDRRCLTDVRGGSDMAPCVEGLPSLLGLVGPFPLMQFHLTYDGELPAASNNTRTREKMGYPPSASFALAELWQNNAVLKEAATAAKVPEQGYFHRTETWGGTASIQVSDASGAGYISDPRRDLCEPIVRNGYKFIPLVRSSLHLACGLNITFLRKGGDLISAGGDLDNRIKVLFDGLRLPSEEDLKKEKPDAEPFYCLLEDDGLITSFSVNTDRLWSRPGSSEKEVRLIIGVTVRATRLTAYNMGFLGN